MDISIRDFDGQAVVALHGQLSLAETPGVVSRLITVVTTSGSSVIVDLAGLDGIGYSGLSVLLRLRKWTRQSGGDLPLAAPREPVRHLLQATGLIDVFSVYPSVEEAAETTRQARAWSQVPSPPQAAPVTRPGCQRPPGRDARRGPVRSWHGRGACRPRRAARNACLRWRPGGTTTVRHP